VEVVEELSARTEHRGCVVRVACEKQTRWSMFSQVERNIETNGNPLDNSLPFETLFPLLLLRY